MSYLTFLTIAFLMPACLLALVWRKTLLRYKKTYLWCVVFVYTIGWFWDWFSYKTGLWQYNAERMKLVIWVDGIPADEFVGFYIFGSAFITVTAVVVLKGLKKMV